VQRLPALASLIALALPLALGAGACRRSAKEPAPVAVLSNSAPAAAAFADLRAKWEARRLDQASVDDFLRRFSDDGAAPHAKAYLAFVLLDQGNLLAADGVLGTLMEIRPGPTRDLVTVARARSLRLHGAPQSALDMLRPLVGKIIDEADREVFLEELAMTAISAHDDYEALAYLDAWLRGVGEDDRERVRAKVAQILETLPRRVLEQTYRAMRTTGAASGYGTDTQNLVAAQLARVAVETNDAALARWLLDVSGVSAAQTGGDAGLELGELAASRRGIHVVTGKTVGLLLPTRSRDLRDEAADVVRGLSWALGLPRGAGRDGIRLVTREDGPGEEGTIAGMEELAGEGATLILAGFDRAGADRASAWSESSGVPVVLLASPSPGRMPKTSAFVLGERPERELSMLADALVRHGVSTAAFVVDTADEEAAGRAAEGRGGLVLLPAVRCDVPLAEAGRSRFPIESWIASGAEGWLISGPPGCSRDVVRDVRAVVEARRTRARSEPTLALTLEAGLPMAEVPTGLVVLAAAAGVVPVLATRAEDVNDPKVRAFMEHFGARPSYWTALGRDAAVLGRHATAPLPTDTTTDPKAIAQRRAIVQAGLLTAREPLWTSDARGFASDRVLPRALRLLTWRKER
jgi:hypothetical protein